MADSIGTLERGARLTLRLLLRGSLTAREAAMLTGVCLRTAQRDLAELSLVVPIYYDAAVRAWVVCREQLAEYEQEAGDN